MWILRNQIIKMIQKNTNVFYQWHRDDERVTLKTVFLWYFFDDFASIGFLTALFHFLNFSNIFNDLKPSKHFSHAPYNHRQFRDNSETKSKSKESRKSRHSQMATLTSRSCHRKQWTVPVSMYLCVRFWRLLFSLTHRRLWLLYIHTVNRLLIVSDC